MSDAQESVKLVKISKFYMHALQYVKACLAKNVYT